MLASAMALSEFWLAHWPAAVGFLIGNIALPLYAMRLSGAIAASGRAAELRASALEASAMRDALTGALNRSALSTLLDKKIAQGERGFVMFIDLDDFKRVNDLHGHAPGDELLCRVVSTIQASLRSTDALARIGGDEFAVILGAVSGSTAGRSRTRSSRRYRSSPTIPPGHSVRASESADFPARLPSGRPTSLRAPTRRCTTPSAAAETTSASSPPLLRLLTRRPTGNRWRRARCPPRAPGIENQPLTAWCADLTPPPGEGSEAPPWQHREGRLGPHHAVTPRILRAIERLVRIVQHHLDPLVPSDSAAPMLAPSGNTVPFGVRSVVHAAIAARISRRAAQHRFVAILQQHEKFVAAPARSAVVGGSPTG